MGKVVRIAPITKTFDPSFKTMESSLAGYGFTRVPGTTKYLGPKVEADGRYRTGLDPKALYIKKLNDEEKKAEIALIKEMTETILDAYPDIDLGPRSKIWNAFSDEPIKTSFVKLGNGNVILNVDDNIQDLLTYCWLRRHPEIAQSMESYQNRECPDCDYYLVNEESENRAIYNKKKEINKAIIAFDALPPTKKKQIARLLGQPVGDSTTDEAVYNMIDTVLKNPTFSSGDYKGLSTINIFNDILKLKDDRLKVKDLIEQAIRYNVYREGNGGKIYEGDVVMGNDKKELTDWLLDDKNQQDLLILEKKLKNKKVLEG